MFIVLGAIITILALIGLRAKKQEQRWIDEYNKESIATFKKAQDAKKKKRQSTPKVLTIKSNNK